MLEKEKKLEWSIFKDTHVSHLLKIDPISRLHIGIGGGVYIINATTGGHGPSWRMIVHMTYEIEAYVFIRVDKVETLVASITIHSLIRGLPASIIGSSLPGSRILKRINVSNGS